MHSVSWIWWLSAALAAGCGGGAAGPPLGEVEGTVKLNGKPVPNLVVGFLPDNAKQSSGPHSSATTDGEGRYRLRCADKRDGAVVGWHSVVFDDPDVDYPAQGKPRLKPPRVPSQFGMAATTPFKREVKPGKQTIDLELSKP